MTLLEQCALAVQQQLQEHEYNYMAAPDEDGEIGIRGWVNPPAITRAILTTIRDNSPSMRTREEMIRILEEGGE